MKIFLAVVLVAVMWNAVITTIQFVQQRKRRLKKRAPRIGDKVEILLGTFKGYIGKITEIGAVHNDGCYCFVLRPDGLVKRYIYPDDISIILQSIEVSSIGGKNAKAKNTEE